MDANQIKNGAMLTWLLFFGSMVPAWYAWRRTAGLGTKLPRWNRRMQRAAFVGLVFLGTFGTLAYALWKLGAPLQLIPGLAWLPLAIVAWAAVSYFVLVMNTRKTGAPIERERHEKPS